MKNPETTNFTKFKTGNPVVQYLINRFYTKVTKYILREPFDSILDAGCGEGMTLQKLRGYLPRNVTAFDLNHDCVHYTSAWFPGANITSQDILHLPYDKEEFDLVICLEVLEHLERPDLALKSLKRVARNRLIFSVPYEPWFQVGSFLRGKYLKYWGNHPEHINHWSPNTFEQFLSREFSAVSIDTSLPWIIAQVRA